MPNKIPTLQDLSYTALIDHIGIKVLDVKKDKLYKMIEKDGINVLDLGRCINIQIIWPCWLNDGLGQIHFTFEKNNDNPHLLNHFYGDLIYSKSVNIIEYEEDA